MPVLPLFDSMTPAFATPAKASDSPLRWQIFYTPNGMTMEQFIPSKTGSDFEFPTILQPLSGRTNSL